MCCDSVALVLRVCVSVVCGCAILCRAACALRYGGAIPTRVGIVQLIDWKKFTLSEISVVWEMI
jgi:hypothetical protein